MNDLTRNALLQYRRAVNWVIGITFFFGASESAWASFVAPDSVKNGLLITGNSLLALVDEKETHSPLSRCINEERGSRIFSNHCDELMANLKKRMSMMALESDLQIQNEKLSSTPLSDRDNQKVDVLSKINLLSLQAEETISSGNDLRTVITAVTKVKSSYLTYRKFYEK